jgi:predicted esterase
VAADSLRSLTRPAAGEPEGLLVLFHGRGADERDLFPLLDVFDPARRLHGATPRGPLHLPPGGAHWYAVHEIGYPDPETFTETFALARNGSTRSSSTPACRTSERCSAASRKGRS